MMRLAAIAVLLASCEKPSPPVDPPPPPRPPPRPCTLDGRIARAEPPYRGLIAILGLEVLSPSPTAHDTQTARVLTAKLRRQPDATRGPFRLAPNTDRELVDEKLINNCAPATLPCMLQIAKALGVDQLLYGDLATAASGTRVRLSLLAVADRSVTHVDDVLSDTSDTALAAWARTAYRTLAKPADRGVLVVTLDGDRDGTILLDDEPRGRIAGGRGDIRDLAPGRYRFGVETTAGCRLQSPLEIREGETVTVDVRGGR
jgi:hypothetical protein